MDNSENLKGLSKLDKSGNRSSAGKGAEFIAYIKSDKKRLFVLLAALIGALLMMLSFVGKNDTVSGNESLADYKSELENELSELCSSISGAGRCRVSVSFSEGERSEYRGTNKISSTPPKIQGITIISEGADRSDVKAALVECMSAMFGIGSNRIAVVKGLSHLARPKKSEKSKKNNPEYCQIYKRDSNRLNFYEILPI